MNEDVEAKPVDRVREPSSLMRRIGIYAIVLFVVFLLGFIPMWLKARAATSELATVSQRLTLAETKGNLASAFIDARRGDYEPARLAASQFFTSLRTEADKGEDSALNAAQRAAVQPLFAQRDEIITLLARSDPAAADRLSDLFAAFRKAMGS